MSCRQGRAAWTLPRPSWRQHALFVDAGFTTLIPCCSWRGLGGGFWLTASSSSSCCGRYVEEWMHYYHGSRCGNSTQEKKKKAFNAARLTGPVQDRREFLGRATPAADWQEAGTRRYQFQWVSPTSVCGYVCTGPPRAGSVVISPFGPCWWVLVAVWE